MKLVESMAYSEKNLFGGKRVTLEFYDQDAATNALISLREEAGKAFKRSDYEKAEALLSGANEFERNIEKVFAEENEEAVGNEENEDVSDVVEDGLPEIPFI